MAKKRYQTKYGAYTKSTSPNILDDYENRQTVKRMVRAKAQERVDSLGSEFLSSAMARLNEAADRTARVKDKFVGKIFPELETRKMLDATKARRKNRKPQTVKDKISATVLHVKNGDGFKDMIKRGKYAIREFWHSDAELNHYGIPGMKWGRRRWRNADGTLTDAGIARYGNKYRRMAARSEKRQNALFDRGVKAERWMAKANDYENGTFFRRPNPKKAAKFKRKGLNARWKASKKLAKERQREQRMDKALNKRFTPADSARIRREYLSDYKYWR